MLILSAAFTVAGSVAVNAADPVYSVNVVGYVNTTFTANQFKLFTNPLDNTNTYAALFPNLTDKDTGCYIYQWDPAHLKYISAVYNGINDGWLDLDTGNSANGNTLAPGQGAFFFSVNTFTNTFVGNVLHGDLSFPITKGFTQVGSIVPQAGSVAYLGLSPLDGDVIYKWTGTKYLSWVYVAGDNWYSLDSGNVEIPTLDVGDAVFYHSYTGFNWTRSFNVNN